MASGEAPWQVAQQKGNHQASKIHRLQLRVEALAVVLLRG